MTPHPFSFCGHDFLADPSGALIWPGRETVVFSDLHLGKGQALAERDTALLPPYDTRETLMRVEAVLSRSEAKTVISLGDSFDRHDVGLRADDLAHLTELMADRQWVWVLGNHDPALPHDLPGETVIEEAIDGIMFRHEAEPSSVSGEVSGHYHPKAAVRLAGRRIRGRCFAQTATRLFMPAFGTYTGGLDVTDPAMRRWLHDDPWLYMCRDTRVVPVPVAALIDD